MIMLNVLKQLVINIVVVMMLTMILEIMVPASVMHRYVKMVLGLLIIIMVLTPVLKFLKNDFDYSSKMLEVKNDIEIESIMAMGEELNKKYNKSVIENFRTNLAEQIRKQVLKIDGLKEVEVNVSVEEDIKSNNFGMITGVYLMLTIDNTTNSTIKPVNEVKIKTDDEKPLDTDLFDFNTIEITETAIQKIVKLYDISPEIVRVSVRRRG